MRSLPPPIGTPSHIGNEVFFFFIRGACVVAAYDAGASMRSAGTVNSGGIKRARMFDDDSCCDVFCSAASSGGNNYGAISTSVRSAQPTNYVAMQGRSPPAAQYNDAQFMDSNYSSAASSQVSSNYQENYSFLPSSIPNSAQ